MCQNYWLKREAFWITSIFHPVIPNGHSAGAPFEHYGPLQSEVAIRHAHEIIEFARSQMPGSASRLDLRYGLKVASTQLR